MINATSTLLLGTNNATSTMLLFMTDSFWFPIVLILLALWILPWKGYALWRAAKNNHKGWFIALLLLNTLSILEISYILFVDRKNKKQ